MGIIAWIVFGLIAGFIASKIVNRSGEGPLLDIVLGVVGAVVGGFLFNLVGASGVTGFNIWSCSSPSRAPSSSWSRITPSRGEDRRSDRASLRGTIHGGNDMGTQGPVVHVERTTQGSEVSPGGGAAPPQ